VLIFIYVLLIAAGVFFAAGAYAHFVRKHEGTVWWRGAMGLLAFAMALTLLEILSALGGSR
jgi:hypothetical protein